LIVLAYSFSPKDHILSLTFDIAFHTAGIAHHIIAHQANSQAEAILCSDCGINTAVSTAQIVAHFTTLLSNHPAFHIVPATSQTTIPAFHNQAGLAICAISQIVLLALYQILSISACVDVEILLSSR